MSILIFGRSGQVAWELKRSCSVLGNVRVLGSDDVNFANQDAIVQVIREMKPRYIINAAAYTDVDRAETEEEQALQVNAYAVGTIAEEAKKCGARLVHYSTDYVFDGAKDSPYTEEDMPSPLNAYGRSKLLGEKLIQEVGGAAVVLRVTWLYGSRGKNFYRTMLRLGQEREELRVVGDQFGVPTWCRHVADATLCILRDSAFKEKGGLYHMTPQGRTNWYGFAEKIFESLDAVGSVTPIKLQRLVQISSEEYVTPAKRPKNSLLNSKKIELNFGIKLPDWQDSLRMVVADTC